MKQVTSNKRQCNLKEKCKKMPAKIYSQTLGTNLRNEKKY